MRYHRDCKHRHRDQLCKGRGPGSGNRQSQAQRGVETAAKAKQQLSQLKGQFTKVDKKGAKLTKDFSKEQEKLSTMRNGLGDNPSKAQLRSITNQEKKVNKMEAELRTTRAKYNELKRKIREAGG